MDKYRITFQTWDNVAQNYQDKFMEMSLYDDTYDSFCRLIEKPNPNVFEIGCGPGNITKYLLSKRPDFKIEAIDVAPNMIRLAQENNPEANFRIMDCRNLENITEKFDGIMCGFCMPYLSKEDCAKLIKDSSALLYTNGILYFSVIEGSYDNSGFESGSDPENKMFVYYHQEENLRNWLIENDFEVIETSRKQYSKADNIISTHLIFIAKKLSQALFIFGFLIN